MTCQCQNGTVWFDHATKKWKHASGDKSCSKPEPYDINTTRPTKRRSVA